MRLAGTRAAQLRRQARRKVWLGRDGGAAAARGRLGGAETATASVLTLIAQPIYYDPANLALSRCCVVSGVSGALLRVGGE